MFSYVKNSFFQSYLLWAILHVWRLCYIIDLKLKKNSFCLCACRLSGFFSCCAGTVTVRPNYGMYILERPVSFSLVAQPSSLMKILRKEPSLMKFSMLQHAAKWLQHPIVIVRKFSFVFFHFTDSENSMYIFILDISFSYTHNKWLLHTLHADTI